MRPAGSRRHRIPLAQLAMVWVEVLWSCRCDYHNVASLRCHGCGSRPPRQLRDLVALAAQPEPEPEPEAGSPRSAGVAGVDVAGVEVAGAV